MLPKAQGDTFKLFILSYNSLKSKDTPSQETNKSSKS